jgi:uncharacterized BrkB/YihY/UPF0761 family membrane protein
MPVVPKEPQPEKTPWAGRAVLRRLPLETETAFFILANVLDILLTYLLLVQGDHREANPIAEFFLNHWGVRGLIYFKMAMVAFICLVTQIIAHYRLATARRLLIMLTAIVGAVVVYSALLLARTTG